MSEKIESRWIGPFPCLPGQNTMSLWMSFGPGLAANPVVVVKARASEKDPWIAAKPVGIMPQPTTYAIQIHTFENLVADTRYSYRVEVNGISWVGEGLVQEDFYFRTFSGKEDSLETVFMSCHGIEAFDKDPETHPDETWEMWRRLSRNLDENQNIRLGILGGDQVYMDDTFQENISKFQPRKPDEMKVKVFKTYLKYWGSPEYRKVMVRLPVYLTWDDHDIIDGWGSRSEQEKTSWIGNSLDYIARRVFGARYFTDKEKWRHYGAMLFQAYDDMQMSRNPAPIGPNASSVLHISGSNATLLLDMRRDRRTIEGTKDQRQIFSPEHRAAIDKAVNGMKNVDSVTIVSPVTLARMSGKIEFFLGSLSNLMWDLGKILGYGKSPLRVAYWLALFVVAYWGLYSESSSMPGVVQACIVSTYLAIFAFGNFKSVKKYFPNRWPLVLGGSLAISAGAIAYIWHKLDQFGSSASMLEVFQQVWAGVKWHDADSRFGMYLSVAVVFYFSFINWSRFLKLLERGLKQNKTKIKKMRGRLNLLGLVGLFVLTVFNWWRGLPEAEIKFDQLCPIIFTTLAGVIAFITFLMSLLEGMGTVDKVAGLNDDVIDAWSAAEHVESLRWFKDLILRASDSGRRKIYLLCGDIHTGGLSEICFPESGNQKAFRFYQVTSSPMSYVTMPALVEKITSGVGTVPLKESAKSDAKIVCEFTNIYFRSQRNYVLLKPSDDGLRVSFEFEDLEKPVVHLL